MSYLCIREKLQQTFAAEHMPLDIHSDYVVVQGSAQCSREKITEIAKRAGLGCPIISEYRLDGNFVFTAIPYKSADAFFRKEELQTLLAPRKYSGPKVTHAELRWAGLNMNRRLVSSALNECVSGIISLLSKDDRAIVEIGSGIGYELSKTVASKTIRIQPNRDECLLLAQVISDPIYMMDIQDLFRNLHEKGRKIPLFFALNVFDTMLPEERKNSFSQIAQLQSRGDRLVIMLDENPEFSATLQQVEALHPGTIALPFLPFSMRPTKLSFVLVPSEHVKSRPSPTEIVDMIHADAVALATEGPSENQIFLHNLQQKLQLKVVALEDFYVNQVKEELANAGYSNTSYYSSAFVTGKLPDELNTPGDLIYKPVTDTIIIKSWEVENQLLKEWLLSKGLAIPPQLDKRAVSQIRDSGLKIIGAEVLVIEATKN
jgi:hypothetical protein